MRFFIILSCLLTAVFATGAYNRKPVYAMAETIIPSASDVWRFGEDKYILFFEQEVAERTVVSNMSAKKCERLCKQYDVTPEQLNVLLCLQYALNTIDCYYGLDELSQMNETEILGLALRYYAAYWPQQTAEKQASLTQKLNALS